MVGFWLGLFLGGDYNHRWFKASYHRSAEISWFGGGSLVSVCVCVESKTDRSCQFSSLFHGSLTSLPPSPQAEKAAVLSVTLWHASALTGGRYNKFSRECSQTPWVIKGKRLTDLSVSECITHVFQRYHQCQGRCFHRWSLGALILCFRCQICHCWSRRCQCQDAGYWKTFLLRTGKPTSPPVICWRIPTYATWN